MGIAARRKIEKALGRKVHLILNVKVAEARGVARSRLISTLPPKRSRAAVQQSSQRCCLLISSTTPLAWQGMTHLRLAPLLCGLWVVDDAGKEGSSCGVERVCRTWRRPRRNAVIVHTSFNDDEEDVKSACRRWAAGGSAHPAGRLLVEQQSHLRQHSLLVVRCYYHHAAC